MTTIAFRSGELAADSASCMNNVWSGSVRKIARAPDGSLAAVSGSTVACALLLQWVEDGMDGLPPTNASDNVSGLLINAAGEAHILESGGAPVRIDGEFHAAGSGREIALGAMAAGASAREAVLIACEYDCGSRGPVIVERI